jgi:hypothetical protein
VCLCLEKTIVTSDRAYSQHITNSNSLVTPYERIRAGFVELALEKNRRATPFVEAAKSLRATASQAKSPRELLRLDSIRTAVLTAAGVSDKAVSHLTEEDQKAAILGLIKNFLEPAGSEFVTELVYRFLLTRGDSLGGSMRNLGGAVAEQKITRALVAQLSLSGRKFHWLHSQARTWISGLPDDPNIETNCRGLSWISRKAPRTLLYNITVPIVSKNVDHSLFAASPADFTTMNGKDAILRNPEAYIALGELKGGIDPAGADEHWKTAHSALSRVRIAFRKKKCVPYIYFIGAAIEKSMANEIFRQLKKGELTNAANLTSSEQVSSLCGWLISL